MIRAMQANDAAAVLRVYGEGIGTGHATFEASAPDWATWDRGRLARGRLVAEEAGTVLGFAALSPVSGRCVYAGVAEVSLYVAEAARGRGLGHALLAALIEASEADGIWTLTAGIFEENRASLKLHAAHGFKLLGRRVRLGRMGFGPLAGHWRDVLFMERRSARVGGPPPASRSPKLALQALFFDVFGTLVDWRSSIAHELAAVLGPRGVVRDWNAMALAWRALYQPAMAPVRTGARGFVGLDDLHRETLLEVLDAFALPGLEAEVIDRLVHAWHRLDPWPDSALGLALLKERFVVAACSNGNLALIVDLARHAGLAFDAVLGAEVAGTYKPMPAVYLRSAELLGLEPCRCCMVAAHNDDLKAAAALGFKTAFLARPKEYGAAQSTDLAPEAPVDIAAIDLLDLARQI